ncbi:hypothetical protein FP435_04585 [Lactobacillus sp. PV037]|uniref:hypothetical protein n=1 Tax=Lactobacillus sp. PV037 TaxID=2594496 RepID=UPI00223F7B88|nr:hypothetical protein [Lactobacillus sp. PV037]QNQ83768.1 hypothetical protein FP435_04585 [Lactobacillus sp. PV037]
MRRRFFNYGKFKKAEVKSLEEVNTLTVWVGAVNGFNKNVKEFYITLPTSKEEIKRQLDHAGIRFEEVTTEIISNTFKGINFMTVTSFLSITRLNELIKKLNAENIKDAEDLFNAVDMGEKIEFNPIELDEENLDAALDTYTPSEVIKSLTSGFNWSDDYFIIDDLGKIESMNEVEINSIYREYSKEALEDFIESNLN